MDFSSEWTEFVFLDCTFFPFFVLSYYSENGEELDEPEKRELTLLKRLRLPTDEDCKKLGPLPNSQNGSDHYHLEAKFRWHFNK